MPQIGQLPGSLRRISGCMGQVHVDAKDWGAAFFANVSPAVNLTGSATNFARQPALQK
jgi:hypothetical protein